VFHVSSSKHHVSISAVAQKVNLGNLGVRNAMRPNERARCRFWASCDVRLSAIVGETWVCRRCSICDRDTPLLIYAQHGLSVTQKGLAFLAVHIGNWIGLLCFPVQRALEYRAIRKKGGERSPEVTLTWGFLAAFLLPISLCFYSCRRPR